MPYARYQILKLHMQILADMEAAGVVPNGLTHSLRVDYHVVLGDAHAAADAYQAALAAGADVSTASFERLLSRCERAGERQLLVLP